MVIPNMVTKFQIVYIFWTFFEILDLSSAHACRMEIVNLYLLSSYSNDVKLLVFYPEIENDLIL